MESPRLSTPDIPHDFTNLDGNTIVHNRIKYTLLKMKNPRYYRRFFDGAERGIRTLDTIPRIHDFQSCALDQLSHLCMCVSLSTFAILQQSKPKSKIYFSTWKNFLKNLLHFCEKRV